MKFREFYFWYNLKSKAVLGLGLLMLLAAVGVLLLGLWLNVAHVLQKGFGNVPVESLKELLWFPPAAIVLFIVGTIVFRWGAGGVGMLPDSFYVNMEKWMEDRRLKKDEYRDHIKEYVEHLIEIDASIEL